jgi:hypothetical protein
MTAPRDGRKRSLGGAVQTSVAMVVELFCVRQTGVARGFVPVDLEGAGDMGQQLGQLHGVPGATAAPRLLEGMGAALVGV